MNSILKFTILLAGLAAAELPLKVRADQALSQLQANIQSNNFTGALPWLEKAVALESEGYKLPSGMGFFAGQVYTKNGENAKAVPYLDAYVNQPVPGKNFWEAVQLLSQASPSKGKAYLETYLAQENPPYYQQALALYTQIEPLAKAEEEKLAKETEKKSKEAALEAEKKRLEAREAAKHGSITDSRDGKTYKTIQIGSQVWMSENLNYATVGSLCCDKESSKCDKWGRLYDWKTARTACPSGWHLPSEEEWELFDKITLIDANKKDFNLVNGGIATADMFFDPDVCIYVGETSYIWSSTESGRKLAFSRSNQADSWLNRREDFKRDALSVRCLKD